MATTFDVFFLGNFASIDPTEGNTTAENASVLVGETIGGSETPLYANIQSFSPGTIGFAGGESNTVYDSDNSTSNETFSIDGGADQTFDAVAQYNLTITYTNGDTATITGVIIQDTAGNTYLLPEFSANSDQDALEARAIESVSIGSVTQNTGGLTADRFDGAYRVPDGQVVGEQFSEDMAFDNGYQDANGDFISNTEGDTVFGLNGDDTIRTGGGDDRLVGGQGNDSLLGGTGNDRLEGGDQDDTLLGGDGNDVLTGGPGSDSILGEAGNDTLELSDNDFLDGGNDTDFLDATFGNFGETISFNADNSGLTDNGSTFQNIEVFNSDGGADFYDASAATGPLTISTGADDDTILAGLGADSLVAGTGNDSIVSNSIGDTIEGGAGNDTIDYVQGTDSVFGGDDDDRIINVVGTTPGAVTTIDGGAGTDTFVLDGVSGSFGASHLVDLSIGELTFSGASRDFISGIENVEIIGSAAGAIGDAGDNVITATGNFANTLSGGAGNDSIDGGEGSDLLAGGAGDDTVLGNLGDDTIVVEDGHGNDSLVGGEDGGDLDTDLLDLSALTSGVTMTFSANDIGSFTNGAETVSFFEFESYRFTDFADIIDGDGDAISLSGTFDLGGGDDVYSGGSAMAETVFAGTGNDTVTARGNNSSVSGGDGNDDLTAEFANTSTLDGGLGDDSLLMAFGAGGTLLGGDGNDTLRGRDAADQLTGGDGNDSLIGGQNNDTLTGGLGSDTVVLENSYGGDSITGGEDAGDGDIDVLDASAVTADGVNIALSGSEDGSITSSQGTANFVDMERFVLTEQNDTLDGQAATTAIIGEGGGGDDTLLGGSGADTFSGGLGSDSIEGGAGNDSLIGGAGGDTILGGDGDDYIDGGDGDDLLRTGAGNDTLVGGAGNDTLLNSVGDDSLVGGAGDDSIVATWGADTLEGGTGNDTLIGGADDDSVEGGAGDDTIFSGSRNIAGDYTEQTGNFQNFTGTGGNSDFTGSTTSDEGSVDQATVGALSGYFIGDTDGNEIHTHTFSQAVAGARIDFNAINAGEQLSFAIDGVSVDLNTLIANGDAVFDGAPNYEVDGTGRIVLSSGGDIFQVGSVTFLRPLTDIDVISTGTNNGFIYEMQVDTNPPTYSDDDFLSGGDDADTFIIENAFGNDTIIGGEGGNDNDVIDLNGLSGPVTVTYDSIGAESGTITDGINTITFSEIERIILTEQNDSVDGSASHSGEFGDAPGINVDGRGGDDTILGGRGGDTIEGGTGADSVVGDYGDDSITGGAGNDTLYGDDTGTAENGNDTIDGGAGADFIDGGNQADSLTGGADDDTITGGSGNDTVEGGTGNDVLSGGDGDDVFTYNIGDGSDTITDFNTGNTGALGDGNTANNDFIDLSNFYDNITELREDFNDDGILNQSNSTVDGGTVDYSNNDEMQAGDGLTFSGADQSSFTADNTGVVCFAAGTLILTDKGEVPVERLRPEDRIVTYDNGLQPLAMLASRHLAAQELSRNPDLKPIEIRAGALGAEQRLVVSPQHMMLVEHEGGEALVRARQLSRLKGGGVRVMQGCRQVTYFHLIFETHQIVFANKRPAESFYPGPRAIAALDNDARCAFFSLFPELRQDGVVRGPSRHWTRARKSVRSRFLPKAVGIRRHTRSDIISV